jgi:hypothetical protein
MFKQVTYDVVWHDSGMIVKRSDGAWLPFTFARGLARRLDRAEVQALGAEVAKLPGAVYKRFSK